MSAKDGLKEAVKHRDRIHREQGWHHDTHRPRHEPEAVCFFVMENIALQSRSARMIESARIMERKA